MTVKNLVVLVLICFLPLVSFSKTIIVDVKKFGAKGDGITNDYFAIKAVADYINKLGGGEVYFPPGDYYIGTYHKPGTNFSDIEFRDCKGLKISGFNAKISLNGHFRRTVDLVKKNRNSFSRTIIPFMILRCSDVSLEDIEIDGNVDEMTRDIGVIESDGHLVKLIDCSNVKLKNLNLHHAPSDGLYITGLATSTIDLTASNLTLSNNARQGASIIKLKNAIFTSCKFVNTGFSKGNYGSHLPSAGLDIEPHSRYGFSVENVVFERCEFSNNKGSQVIVTSTLSTKKVSFLNCKIDSRRSDSKYTMILAGRDIVLTQSSIECGSGSIYPMWRNMANGSVEISKCRISSDTNGIIAALNLNNYFITIVDNHLIFTGKTLKSYFPYLKSVNLNFVSNTVVFPSSALVVGKTHSLIQSAKSSINNVFRTNVKGEKPIISYQGTQIVKDF